MPTKQARGKWEPRFHPGVFFRGSGCHRAGTGDQDKANIRRVPESKRWDADSILQMRATPWSPDGSDNAFDIRVGMERPAEMVPRDPGEVLMETDLDLSCLVVTAPLSPSNKQEFIRPSHSIN